MHRNLKTSLLILVLAISTGLTYGQENAKKPRFISKNGFGLVMPDSTFSIVFRFRIQSRVGIAAPENDLGNITEADFRIRRMRLRFEGFMLNPRLTYNVQLSFSRADQDWDNSGIPLVLRDAMVHYALTKHFTVSLGQGKLPGNRQRVVSSGDIHFTDRSIVNSAYTLDRDVGLFGTYRWNFGKMPYFLFKGAITSGEGRGIANSKEFPNTVSPNGGVAYTARVEFLPFGEFTNRGDYFEGDLEHEPKPKVSVGATYHYNDRAIRTQGQLGKAIYSPRSFEGTEFDFLLKFRGIAYSAEYISRHLDNGQSEITRKSTTDSLWVLTGYGINQELSYTFKNMWEIAVRYAFTEPDKGIWSVGKDGMKSEEFCLGFIKYLNKHRVKVVNEFSYYRRTEMTTGVQHTGLVGFKCQLELGI